MILADRLSVLLILVALGALALEVQRPPNDVGRLVVRWLFEHRTTMMPLLLELLLVSGISGPAAAAAAAAAGRLRALLEPRGAAVAVGAAASAPVRPAVVPGFDRAHFRRYLITAAPTLGCELAGNPGAVHCILSLRQCRSDVLSVRSPARCAPPLEPALVFFHPRSRLVDKYRASGPMGVIQQEGETLDDIIAICR